MGTIKTLAVLAHPTKVDTLRTEVHKLHSTVDSLNKQVHDFGVASTYFHDIVNTDVATFIGIVTIIFAGIGFLSWRVVKQTALNVKKELSDKWGQEHAKQHALNKLLEEKMQDFTKKDAEHSFNNSRLMYTTACDQSQFVTALIWSLNAVLKSFIAYGSENGFHTYVWIGNVREMLAKDLPKAQLDLMIGNIDELLAQLKKLKDNGIDKVIEEVKAKVNKVIYA